MAGCYDYYPFSKGYSVVLMKRRVMPVLLGMSLLIAAATALISWGVVKYKQREFNSSQLQNDVSVTGMPAAMVVNETLLKLAAAKLGEAHWKQKIEQLIDGGYDLRDIRDISSTSIPVNMQSPQVYQVWLDFMHAWWRNKPQFESDIMSNLVDLVKVLIDRKYNEGVVSTVDRRRRYSSCSVVGNSGILLQSENGELIDSHEAVIRLNNAGITGGGLERHVGSKTTFSFISSDQLHFCAGKEDCFCHPYGVSVPIVTYMCEFVHFLDYTLCNSSHKAPLVITDPRFDLFCARIVKYYSLKRFVEKVKKPLEEWGYAQEGVFCSSGMQAVMLAVGICDKVTLFGFGKSESAKNQYHTNRMSEFYLHDFEAEYDLYHDLIDRPKVIPFISDKFKFPSVSIYK